MSAKLTIQLCVASCEGDKNETILSLTRNYRNRLSESAKQQNCFFNHRETAGWHVAG